MILFSICLIWIGMSCLITGIGGIRRNDFRSYDSRYLIQIGPETALIGFIGFFTGGGEIPSLPVLMGGTTLAAIATERPLQRYVKNRARLGLPI